MIERILFRGAAWGVISYFGAVQAIELERRRTDSCISKKVKLHGLSAGSLALLLYVLGFSERRMCELYESHVSQSRDNLLSANMLDVTKLNMVLLEDIFKEHPNAYERINEENVRIGITTRKGFRFVKDFESNLHLANVLMCSFHIPCLSNFDANINGEQALDGGIGFNASVFVESNRDESFIIGASHPESHVNFDMTTLFLMIPPPVFLHNHYLAVGYNRTAEALRDRSFDDSHVVKYTNPLSDPRNSLWWFVQDNRTCEKTTFDQLKECIRVEPSQEKTSPAHK